MTNMEATMIYRREIADAITTYNRTLREIFAVHLCPIPPSPECAGAMANAWGTCRVAFAIAGAHLNIARARMNEAKPA